MIVTSIAALAPNRVIGKNNKLPWHLPADLKFFKKLTTGHHIIMGRKTWQALPNGALPNRINIIISRSTLEVPEGVLVFKSLEPALEWVFRQEETEAFIIGGAQIYQSTMNIVDKMILTEVDIETEGDAHFPEWRDIDWEEETREAHPADEKNPHPFSFVTYLRKKKRKDGGYAWRSFDY